MILQCQGHGETSLTMFAAKPINIWLERKRTGLVDLIGTLEVCRDGFPSKLIKALRAFEVLKWHKNFSGRFFQVFGNHIITNRTSPFDRNCFGDMCWQLRRISMSHLLMILQTDTAQKASLTDWIFVEGRALEEFGRSNTSGASSIQGVGCIRTCLAAGALSSKELGAGAAAPGPAASDQGRFRGGVIGKSVPAA